MKSSVFASGLAAIVFATAIGLFAPGDGGGGFSGIIVFAGFFVGVLFGTPLLIVLGILPVWLMERRLRAQPQLALAVGTASGLLAAAAYLWLTATEYTFQPSTGVFTSGTVPTLLFSAFHGFFWIWVLKRQSCPTFESRPLEHANA